MLIRKPHRSRQRSLHTSTSDVCSVWKFIVCTSLSSATEFCTSCPPSVWFASLNFRCHFRLNRRDLVCDLSLHIRIPSFDWLSLSGMEDRPIELFYPLEIEPKRIYKRMLTQTLSTNTGPLILWFIRGNLIWWNGIHFTPHFIGTPTHPVATPSHHRYPGTTHAPCLSPPKIRKETQRSQQKKQTKRI